MFRWDMSSWHNRIPIEEFGHHHTKKFHIGNILRPIRIFRGCSRIYFAYSQKESGRFDLPIALGILAASGQLRPIRGALAMTFAMHRSGNSSGHRRAFILPRANAAEAALVRDAVIYTADSLLQVCAPFAATDDYTRLGRHAAQA